MAKMNELVLHTDEHILVADKPAGLSTNPGGWEAGGESLVATLETDYGRLWVVHRLDRGTSGLVVFAHNPEAHRILSRLFETRAVTKAYHALLNGVPAWDEHTARHPLRLNVGHSHRTAVDHSHGKPSETAFRVLERFGRACLVEAAPRTGRTHQVRVHAYALGFPLLGDTLYSAPACGLIDRPALHACELEFEFDGRRLHFSAPYPQDFLQALEQLRAGQ
jgi:tRNA pseudouridine32 synthase/23S rRNA pseudouridine746 synthase